MAFLEHIPGIQPFQPAAPAAVQKGVGILGLHEGRTLLLAMNRVSHARAVAACDLAPDKIEACRRERPDVCYTSDYHEMLARPDVEVVAIYTPDREHGAHVVLAFEAGKDVLCTKPLVNSLADAKAVLDAARRTGRKLMVGQSTRFFEPFQRQRRAFEQGALGAVELAEAHYVHRMDWLYAKSAWAATDTDWVFLGLSHPLDLVRWYLGAILEVHAFGSRSRLGQQHGVRGFDVYTVNLRAQDGRLGRAMGHYGCHELPSARNGIECLLWGERGTSLAQYHDMRYLHTAPDGSEVTEDSLYALRHWYFNSEVHGMHYGEFASYMEHFAKALIEGTPHSPDLEEGLETFCVMEAVRRSAREGRAVEVAPLLAEIGSPQMTCRICVVGSLNMDLVVRTPRLPQPGETVTGAAPRTFPGGKGANQAVAAARLGAQVTMIGCVGADSNGQEMRVGLRREGIDVERLIADGDHPTGMAFITVDDRGENTIVVVGGANAALAPAHVEERSELIAAADVVVLQLETPLQTVHRAAALAQRAKRRVLLNAAPAQRLPADLLRRTDVLVVNRLEAAFHAKAPPQTDPPDLARQLVALGVRCAIVTLGARGAVLCDGAQVIQQPAFPVPTVDAVAAGDAFVGALAVALGENMAAAQALRWACAAGALATTKQGAQPSLPLRAQVEQLAG